MNSAFGIDHGDISKADGFKRDKKLSGSEAAAGAAAGGAGVGLGATKVRMREHSHYSKKTQKKLKKLPPGTHEVPTKWLAKKPRKLGARRQQRSYVAAMAQERPVESFKNSPVPITRYKDGIIQRDNAHSVMANAMKGRKTTIKIEDAPGYRPTRPAGEELVRRAQSKYQERRLKAHTNLPEKKIEALRGKYKESSRRANTHKRPHGVVEDTFKYRKKKYNAKAAFKAGKHVVAVSKKDDRRGRDVAAGAAGVAGTGTLASTPVRRSAAKVKIKDGQMSSKDAKKIVSPGYRPGNKRAIQVMARNLGHLENEPTKVIRYKDGRAIPFDGNHRATARIARGDKTVPVKVIEGKDRPTVSVARNAYHVGQQRLHRKRMNRGDFKPNTDPTASNYRGKHAGEYKTYSSISNASKTRSGKRVNIASTRTASGMSTKALRSRQALTVGAGTALLGGSYKLARKKNDD